MSLPFCHIDINYHMIFGTHFGTLLLYIICIVSNFWNILFCHLEQSCQIRVHFSTVTKSEISPTPSFYMTKLHWNDSACQIKCDSRKMDPKSRFSLDFLNTRPQGHPNIKTFDEDWISVGYFLLLHNTNVVLCLNLYLLFGPLLLDVVVYAWHFWKRNICSFWRHCISWNVDKCPHYFR